MAGMAVQRPATELAWVLQLAGEHDLSTAPRIAAAFDRITEAGTAAVVDLSDASFIDSTVIRTLLGFVTRGEDLLLVVPERGVVSSLGCPVCRLFMHPGASRLLETRWPQALPSFADLGSVESDRK